jgi:hypothetical protein
MSPNYDFWSENKPSGNPAPPPPTPETASPSCHRRFGIQIFGILAFLSPTCPHVSRSTFPTPLAKEQKISPTIRLYKTLVHLLLNAAASPTVRPDWSKFRHLGKKTFVPKFRTKFSLGVVKSANIEIKNYSAQK